jgi:hypothetical protein
MKSRKNLQLYFLLLLVIVLLGIYFYFFSFIDASYSPYYGDEFFYFKNAESFYQTSELKAAFTYSGNGSTLIGFDPHGPAYPLLYGFLAKVFGWFNPLIPIINFSILSIALLLLLFQEETSLQVKSLQLILILGSPITLFYSFSFMPELIQIAGAILLFLQFKRYHKIQNRSDLILLIFLILFLGLIRSTWFFGLIGLIVYPKKIHWGMALLLLLPALGLSYLSQILFHEMVPNTFTGIGELIRSEQYVQVAEELLFNLKRNLYFALTYSEGKFYTIQKIWMLASIILAFLFFRKEKLIQVGLLIFGLTFIFNMFFYKNYSWNDLRIYSPMLLFLNLSMISSSSHQLVPKSLVMIGLSSFILILPLSLKLINYRINSNLKVIPESAKEALLHLEQPLILIDTLVLKDYSLDQLPIINRENYPIRYILPYYEMKMEKPTHQITEQNGQIRLTEVNILSQKARPNPTWIR